MHSGMLLSMPASKLQWYQKASYDSKMIFHIYFLFTLGQRRPPTGTKYHCMTPSTGRDLPAYLWVYVGVDSTE